MVHVCRLLCGDEINDSTFSKIHISLNIHIPSDPAHLPDYFQIHCFHSTHMEIVAELNQFQVCLFVGFFFCRPQLYIKQTST